MTNDLFVKIVSGIITILIAVITGFLIPWIKSKISVAKFDKITYYISMAVRCAEQIYTVEQWEQKKQYVTNYITDLCNNTFMLSLSSKDIDVLIEGAVNQIKKG